MRLESLSIPYETGRAPSYRWAVQTAIEETLEMAGVAVFVAALVDYIHGSVCGRKSSRCTGDPPPTAYPEDRDFTPKPDDVCTGFGFDSVPALSLLDGRQRQPVEEPVENGCPLLGKGLCAVVLFLPHDESVVPQPGVPSVMIEGE